MFSRRAFVLASGAAAALLSSTAHAQGAPPKMTGSAGNLVKRRARIAAPTYPVTFITQQQATAVASIGARTRLNTVLSGVDTETLQRLANEAHADLVAKLKAAGFDVAPPQETAGLLAGLETVPSEITEVGPGITINKSIRAGWHAYGAEGAPIIKAYHDPGAPVGGVQGLASIGATRTLGASAKAIDAVALVPHLIIDYADMEASTGSNLLGRATASAGGNIRFSVRQTSSVMYVGAEDRGAPYAMGLRLDKPIVIPGEFATVQEGGAAVRVGSMGATTDSNYQVRDRARGDAVVVNAPVWEGMVRQAYGAFNDAIVAATLKAKG